MKLKITRSSGNVFSDLGFPREEAEQLRLRSELMFELRNYLREQNLSNAETAKLLKLTPSRTSALMRGKFEDFRIDMLVALAIRAGMRVEMKVAA